MNKEIEDIMVKEYLNGATAKELSIRYSYHNSTISRLMKRRGVSRGRTSFKRTQIKDKVIKDFKNGLYCEEIAKKYDVEVHTIYHILDEAKIKRVSGYHTNCNKEYFQKIDSANKAYLLGFITADGAVVDRSLSIEVEAKDKEVLNFFRKEINEQATITPCFYGGKHNYKISFNSIDICRDLKKYGIVQNKSKIIERVPIELIPQEYLSYYFRGLIDGDGCVLKNGGVSIYSGSKVFIEDVQKILCDILKLKKLKVYHGTSYFISWSSKEDRLKLYNFLYKDKLNIAYYYSRKYERLYNSLFGNTEVSNQIAKG